MGYDVLGTSSMTARYATACMQHSVWTSVQSINQSSIYRTANKTNEITQKADAQAAGIFYLEMLNTILRLRLHSAADHHHIKTSIGNQYWQHFQTFCINYFARGGGCEVFWWVCLSVCLSVCEDISRTTHAIFTKFFLNVDVAYVRRSVLLRHVYDRPHRL